MMTGRRFAHSILIVSVAGLLLTACARPKASGGSERSYPAFTVEERIGMAEAIVLARVVRVGPSRWDTPDGRRPAKLEGHRIYTDVKLVAVASLKGPIKAGEAFTVRVPGGTVGMDTMEAEDAVELSGGETAYLLLGRLPANLATGTWNVWLGGKFTQLANGRVSNGEREMTLEQIRQLATE